MLLGASRLLVRPVASSYLKLFYGQNLDELSALRHALGLKPRIKESKPFDFFPKTEKKCDQPTNTQNSLLSSMTVISNKKSDDASTHAAGIIEKVRGPGLAYYEWSFFYNRLIPQELQYLTQDDNCGVCHSSFSSLDETRHHYLSEEHQREAGIFLDKFFSTAPSEKPLKVAHIDHTVWHQMYDRPLPDQLTDQCTRTYCELCDVKFSDDVEMKRHYSRLQHRLKVEKYLGMLYPFSPEKVPQRIKMNYWFLLWKGIKLPAKLLVQCTPNHCKLCDEHLENRKAADSHYLSDQHTGATDQFLGEFFAGSREGAPVKVERSEVNEWTRRFGDLPSAITNRCSETRCDLCQTDLPNFGMAKNHYEGRVHLDVVRAYLYQLRMEGYEWKKGQG